MNTNEIKPVKAWATYRRGKMDAVAFKREDFDEDEKPIEVEIRPVPHDNQPSLAETPSSITYTQMNQIIDHFDKMRPMTPEERKMTDEFFWSQFTDTTPPSSVPPVSSSGEVGATVKESFTVEPSAEECLEWIAERGCHFGNIPNGYAIYYTDAYTEKLGEGSTPLEAIKSAMAAEMQKQKEI